MKSAAEFLAAIQETTGNTYTEGAIAYLEERLDQIRAGLDTRGIKGRERDATIAFEFMLLGVQLKLRKTALQAAEELAARGKDTDGKAPGKLTLN